MKRLIASSILSAGALFGLCSEADAGFSESITGAQAQAFRSAGTNLVVNSSGSARPSASIRGSALQSRAVHGTYHRQSTPQRYTRDYRQQSTQQRYTRDYRRDCSQRIWVPPCYREVLVGYECCGTPIYRRVMVHQGYWKTVRNHRH